LTQKCYPTPFYNMDASSTDSFDEHPHGTRTCDLFHIPAHTNVVKAAACGPLPVAVHEDSLFCVGMAGVLFLALPPSSFTQQRRYHANILTQAAGVPSIAHASGGPALDIIDAGRTGMLATTADEYSEALAALLYAPDAAVTRQRIARQARESVRERFSQEQFAATFVANMRRVLLRCRFG